MKKVIFILLLGFPVILYPQQKFTPVANPGAVVKAGQVRFTVLTPGLIRMEWDSLGKFEDHASLLVINRNLPVPEFKVNQISQIIEIITSAMKLTYING